MSLPSIEVITVSAVLVGALVTIWGVWLRREFSETLGKFRLTLRSYRRKKSKDLLGDIRKSVRAKDEEEALDEISEYTDNWYYLTQAVTKLLEEDKRIHDWVNMFLFSLP